MDKKPVVKIIVNMNYFNYEYFWADENYQFQRKNIILNQRITEISSLPIIDYENELNTEQLVLMRNPSLKNRLIYLHPEHIINSPITGVDNHYYVLSLPFNDINKKEPHGKSQVEYLNKTSNNNSNSENETISIYFTIRQKVKCSFIEKKNSFYIQKLIDEIIFVLKKVNIPLTDIYYSEKNNNLIYILKVYISGEILICDIMTKYLIDKILAKNNVIFHFLPEVESIKNECYFWSIQFPVFESKHYDKIKESLVSIFQKKNGCLIHKEKKPIDNKNNQKLIDFITIKTNYQICELQNIFNNIDFFDKEINEGEDDNQDKNIEVESSNNN